MFVITLILLIIITLAYFIRKRKQFSDSLPPGPRAWPLIGNLLQIDRIDPKNTFVEWHKKYGPVFTVWFGIEPYIMITGYDLMQELFVKRGDEFSDRPYSFLLQDFMNGKSVHICIFYDP